ncbi:uncharacterized protein LOC752605 [Strongylocentrotus purpuratus]|uniref:F-box/LRR-repeat protein 15-like leucin rich repeat domain-containing protein n=2 Tax=Strongylocentrotus purpuratus TaxID=7668 RepID=A0A7M7PT30_STRPU|nr:uncharacterized protein LOC752605 [Strongylocentrotus purpuratus]
MEETLSNADHEKATFLKNTTLVEIKATLKTKDSLQSVQFDQCACVNEDAIRELVAILNPRLRSLCVVCIPDFTNNAVAILSERCHDLEYVRFDSCPRLDRSALELLGTNCKSLKSVTFTRADGVEWKLVDSALDALTKHCKAPLEVISFVRFTRLTDNGLRSLSKQYSDSLNNVDFSACEGISDDGLYALAGTCTKLKHIALNRTSISDKGLAYLAEKRRDLLALEVGNCIRVTDAGIRSLARFCHSLESISVEHCIQITDEALKALSEGCFQLERLNFSQTGLTCVPSTILSLGRLKNFQVHMCKELSSPPQEIIEREVDGLVEYFCERSLGFRLRLMVFGPSGGGKTSFVKSICSGVAEKAGAPTDGLDVTCWWPFRGTKNDSLFNHKLTAGERSLAVEIWDLSGRPVCQRCLHMFITPATLPVIVFNLADSESCDAVVQYADFIHSRVPGGNFVLVGTHSDELYAEDKRSGQSRRVLGALTTRTAQYTKVFKEEIANIEKLSGKKSQQHCKDRIQHLKKRLEGLPKGPPQLITVSTLTSKGLEEATKAILSTILDKKSFPHLRYEVRPETTKVFEEILTLRKKNVLLVPKHDLDAIFKQNGVPSSTEGMKDDVQFLQDAGAIFPFAFPTARGSAYSSDIICVDPTSMALALHAVHLDTSTKDFRFESKRFWPKAATTKKPAPSVLVKALEEVATQGRVIECILPLLCQSLQLDESQVLHLIDLLTKLGVLLKDTKESSDDQFSCLELPSYRSLSTKLIYHLPLLGFMPQNGPTLNWTPKPFRGDVQLGWRYRFQLGTPPGLVAQLLAYCRSRVRQTSYQHQWRSGLLLKIGQALVNINEPEMTEFCPCLDVVGRVTSDLDEEGDQRATEIIWGAIARVLLITEQFLQEWPGFYKMITITPFSMFYTCSSSEIEVAPEVPLQLCLHTLFSGNTSINLSQNGASYEIDLGLMFPTLGEPSQSVHEWLEALALSATDGNDTCPSPISETPSTLPDPSRLSDEVAGSSDSTPHKDAGDGAARDSSSPMAKDKKVAKKKAVEIKWDLVEEKTTKISEENEIKEARRVAKAFVAVLLAESMAKYIYEHEDSSNGHASGAGSTTNRNARHAAAKASAEAARAAQSGDAEAAAKAVVAAVKAVEDVTNPRKNHTRIRSPVKSKMCIVV